MAACPEAQFWLEVFVDPPISWLEEHPEECAGFCVPEAGTASAPVVSWASERWRKESGTALERLLRFVRQASWAPAFVGVQIAAGQAGAWRHPQAERLPDVGACMTRRFRAFAWEKYRHNEALLRQTWDDPRARFEEIACPRTAERSASDVGVFRNPLKSRRILDYYECFFQEQNASALSFLWTARRAAGSGLLVGIAYGHVIGGAGLLEAEHGFPTPVLEAPEVDFFANAGSPYHDYPCALTGSLALTHKFLFHGAEGPRAAEAVHTAALHRCGLILPADTSPESLLSVQKALSPDTRVAASVQPRIRRMAVLVDPMSLACVAGSEDGRWLNTALLRDQIRELARTDIPFSLYTPADLFRSGFPDHEIYLSLNLFYLTEAERRRLDARIKQNGHTAIWLWAPGIIAEESLDASEAEKLCGLRLRLTPTASGLQVRSVQNTDPLGALIRAGSRYGPDRSLAPTVTVPDRSAVRLGANSEGKTVCAVLRRRHWTSVFLGTPLVRAEILVAAASVMPEIGERAGPEPSRASGGAARATAKNGVES